ncbi:MAG TPA: hypothetical protein VEJ63_19925 [Planctomycetota bacterium]|nr:hypothetical protein [Planctomycetota bacterium]
MKVAAAAKLLHCSNQTVRNLFAQGWLDGTQKGKLILIATKSVFQYIVLYRASRMRITTFKRWRKRRQNPERFSPKDKDAKCLSIDERTVDVDVAKSAPLHAEAVASHQFSFGWFAHLLAPHDLALQDDIVQEMSLAVLQYNKPASFEYLFELAKSRAQNYLRYEMQRGMIGLDELQSRSDTKDAALESFDVFVDSLIAEGIPLEWIEEVLGVKLERRAG